MSTTPFASSPSSFFLPTSIPNFTLTRAQSAALDSAVVDESWSPPIPWDDLDLPPDTRKWVEGLANHSLLSKADGACVCGHYYRRIIQYGDHFTRVGRTTCHLFTCRNCGTGKMRRHRLAMLSPHKFREMTEQDGQTIRLTIQHTEPSPDLASYLIRVRADKRKLAAFKRDLKRVHKKEFGFQMSIQLDPHRQEVAFRIFYVGPELSAGWIRRHWQRIVGGIGTTADSESRHYTAGDEAKEALRWVLDTLTGILLLDGERRAEWEKEFDGERLTSAVGTLRGLANPDGPESEPADESKGNPAPYGYCPCGCGGVVEKVTDHSPMSISDLERRYKIVQFGPLSTYMANRLNVHAPMPSDPYSAARSTANARAAPC